MKIISVYFRENEKYSIEYLRDSLSLNITDLEYFIKKLCAYGIIKIIKRSKGQLDMDELAEDSPLSPEEDYSSENLYAFTYVGIITFGNRIIKVYPKYLITKTHKLNEDMKQIIRVLKKYKHSRQQNINLLNGDGKSKGFNYLSLMLYLLYDYYEYGIYTKIEDSFEINGNNEILWGKTIDDFYPLIYNNQPYYTDFYTKKSLNNDADYFARLHRCILTDCYKQLKEAQLDTLFDISPLNLSDEALDAFGNENYISERIYKELNNQFNTRLQILLKTMYAYICHEKRLADFGSGINLYGTTAYNKVWEEICSKVFDNKLHTPINQLNLSTPLSDKYNGNEELIDIIEKPIWKGVGKPKAASKTLIPDLVNISKINNEDCFIILDAKYYNLILEKDKNPENNPGVEDITKQYLYQLAYNDFIKEHNIKKFKNCFVMPTEQNKIIRKGIAKMKMLSALGLNEIQIRQVPAKMMYEHYLNNKKIDIALLEL